MVQSTGPWLPMWSPLPPSDEPTYIPVVWPKPGRPVEGHVLCQRPFGCWTHPEVEGSKCRTYPCIGRENGCPVCSPHTRLRWQGYVPIFAGAAGRILIAQVTKEAWARNPALNDPRRMLRGLYLRLERLGKNPNGRVQAAIETNGDKVTLPPCPDTAAALCRLWGIRPAIGGKGVAND